MNSVIEQTEQQTVDAPAGNDYKYWAFISYSHQDEEWAGWLHKELETYRVPRRLVGRQTKSGVIPRRLFPVFRDRDELPGASDLGGNIRNALSQSRYLVVICSPKSAVSKWVNEEVKGFKALGREHRVLCLIVDGEPNATDKPESGLLECFPPAVRHKVAETGELLSERTEPIAADARKGKDGRDNAKLKLLSGILDVGYDELKQRERQRVIRRRVRLSGLAASLVLLMTIAYVIVADAGINVPAGASIRTFLDRYEASLLRPVHDQPEIQRAASGLRRTLQETLRRRQHESGWISPTLDKNERQLWSHSQAMSAVLRQPDASAQSLGSFLAGLDISFSSGDPIEEAKAPPEIWTALALATALGKPGLLTGDLRQRVEARLVSTQESLKSFHPLESGGWNMFRNQKDPSKHHTYTTTLALLALLGARQAQLPWDGSTERRDALLRNTARWLIAQYDSSPERPGWRGIGEDSLAIYDGLTLQIYAELLWAESEAGIQIPPHILEQIPKHLMQCAERNLNFPVDGGEFNAVLLDSEGKENTRTESIKYLWYPWAIEAAARWLRRVEKENAPKEDRVQARRVLSHLIMNLGEEAVKKAGSDYTFIVSENLYGMAAVE